MRIWSPTWKFSIRHTHMHFFGRKCLYLVKITGHYLNQCWPSPEMPYDITRPQWVNTLRPRQNGRRFTDNIFKCVFLNENVIISIKIKEILQYMYFCSSDVQGSRKVFHENQLFKGWHIESGQNGQHFGDNIFKCIILNENFRIT